MVILMFVLAQMWKEHVQLLYEYMNRPSPTSIQFASPFFVVWNHAHRTNGHRWSMNLGVYYRLLDLDREEV